MCADEPDSFQPGSDLCDPGVCLPRGAHPPVQFTLPVFAFRTAYVSGGQPIRGSKTYPKGTAVLHIEDILEVLEKVRFNPANFPGNKDCCICMVDYREGDDVTILPCNRMYHAPKLPKGTTSMKNVSRNGS